MIYAYSSSKLDLFPGGHYPVQVFFGVLFRYSGHQYKKLIRAAAHYDVADTKLIKLTPERRQLTRIFRSVRMLFVFAMHIASSSTTVIQ